MYFVPDIKMKKGYGLAELFSISMKGFPQDQVAFVSSDGSTKLTYSSLELQSSKLALHLTRHLSGFHPGFPIAILVEECDSYLICMLGILKAGCPYVPINTDFPFHKIEKILQDLGPQTIVIVQNDINYARIKKSGYECVKYGQFDELEDSQIHKVPITIKKETEEEESIAYIIYTSGSTGQPKGVVVSHRSLIHVLQWFIHEFNYTQVSKCSLFLNRAFDASVAETWPALLSGATLYEVPNQLRVDPKRFLGWVAHTEITICFLPTAFGSLFLNCCEKEVQKTGVLETLLLGGEALSSYPSPDLQFNTINCYGPTEATVQTTYINLKGYDPPTDYNNSSIPPIGKPLPGVEIHILDEELTPTAEGETGEIFISGVGVSEGYWNRPDLNSKYFLPFGKEALGGSFIYRTGDLGTRMSDGNIMFKGRKDGQVKVRGYRFELDDIDSTIRQHENIAMSATILHSDSDLVVSFIVPNTFNKNPASYEDNQLQLEKTKIIETVYEEIVTNRMKNGLASFSGWTSSFTGLPIPLKEMEEWLNDAINCIQSLCPKIVLEIGSGSGLIFDRILPLVDSYTATDISSNAVNELKWRTNNKFNKELKKAARFFHRPAHEFDFDSETKRYDTVIMNSVVQYFPDVDYFLKVLEGALNCTSPGGSIFIGDIRSLQLLETYHTEKLLNKSKTTKEEITLEEFLLLLEDSIEKETELVIDPQFFHEFGRRNSSRIASVKVLMKTGWYVNELNSYRYNVTIHTNPFTALRNNVIETVVWNQQLSFDENIGNYLSSEQERKYETLAFLRIPNSRVHSIYSTSQMLKEKSIHKENESLVKNIIDAMQDNPNTFNGILVNPAKVSKIAKEAGFHADLIPDEQNPEQFHAILYRDKNLALPFNLMKPEITHTSVHEDLSQFTTNPSMQHFKHKLTQDLKSYLEERLPAYMIPSQICIMERLPVTPNGKVDKNNLKSSWTKLRSALVKLDHQQNCLNTIKTDCKFSNAEEKLVASAWACILNIPMNIIQPTSNFFHLGGNSLQCVKVVDYLEDNNNNNANNNRGISVADVFRYPMLKVFAKLLGNPISVRENNLRKRQVETLNVIPLNEAQNEMLFHLEHVSPDVPLYNETVCIVFPQPLSLKRLEKSLQFLIARNPMLMANLELSSHNFQLCTIKEAMELSSIVTFEKGFEESVVLEASKSNFDLRRGPLVKFMGPISNSCDDKLSKLFIVFHHIVMDGYSLNQILLPQLHAIYEKAVLEDMPNFETNAALALEIENLTKFHLWETELLHGNSQEQNCMQTFWRTYLDGWIPIEFECYNINSKTHRNSAVGSTYSCQINEKGFNSLHSFCKICKTTPYITLLSVLDLLLYRYTQQRDLTICAISPGRFSHEVDNSIGHFAKLFPVRTKLEGQWTFKELANNVSRSISNARQYEHYPFNTICEAFTNTLSGRDFSRVVFSMDPYTTNSLEIDWKFDQTMVDIGVAKFNLLIRAQELESAGMFLHFQFNTDLYELDTIERFSKQFCYLLEQLRNICDSKLCEINILPEDQRDLIIHRWNDTDSPFPKDKPLVQSIYERVLLSPHCIAVSDGNRTITYLQLYSEAQKLAQCLRSKCNVNSCEFVAILLPRSIEYVISVIAVLMAEAVYVPLNEEYSDERLEFMLRDTGASCIILGEANNKRKFGICPAVKIRNFTTPSRTDVVKYPPEPPSILKLQENTLACVLYTSGSTGQPKGVMLSQRGIQSFCSWLIQTSPVKLTNHSTMIVSPAFDVCIFEIFPYLFSGSRIHVAPEECRFDPNALLEWVVENGITSTYLPTALAELFLQQDFTQELCKGLKLRKLFTAGEKLTFYPREDLPFDTVNCYAPTEATVQTTAKSLTSSSPRLSITPSIGSPTFNCKVYVLDPHFNAVPIGVPGELYIGGEGVSLGYLGRPQLTKEKYIPDIFSPGIQRKLYRTGDIVRWLPNGEIDFLSRIDDQVKFRGYRVELGEIEYHLGLHIRVRSAAVVVVKRGENYNIARMVGHIVPSEKGSLKISNDGLAKELVAFLKLKLPSYMIPSGWVVHNEKFPLTPNGKVDRKSLTTVSSFSNTELFTEEEEELRSETEKKLTKILSSILNLPKVSLNDNFFDIGGHSLAAVQMISKVNSEFGTELSFRDVLTHGTVKELSQLIEGLNNNVTTQELQDSQIGQNMIILHQGKPGGKTLFLIHAVGGTVLAYKALVSQLIAIEECSDVTIIGIQDPSVDKIQEGPVHFSGIPQMASEYVKLIRTVQKSKPPYYLAGHSYGGLVAFEMARQLGREAKDLVMLDPPAFGEAKSSNEIEKILDLECKMKIKEYEEEGNVENAKDWVRLARSRYCMALTYSCSMRESRTLSNLVVINAREADGRRETYDAGTFWSQWTDSPVQVNIVGGDHYTMLRMPHVKEVSMMISSHIKKL
jgi:amino acid adenylation domain-containing protein